MVKKKLKQFSVLLIACLIIIGCQSNKSNGVAIYVAAGLNPVIKAVKLNPEYSTIVSNSASSGTLARQIKAGAQADVYFSANYKWIEYLVKANMIDSSHVSAVASNQLVLVIPSENSNTSLDADSINSFLSSAEIIAIGNPDYVPVGEYTRQYLQNIGCYKTLSSNFLTAKDVMSTLKLIEMGEADCGFVYKTAALQSKKVKIVYTVPNTQCESINFYAVALTSLGSQLLNSDRFQALFKAELVKAGFGKP